MEQVKIESTLDSVSHIIVEGTDTTQIDTLQVLTDQGDTAMVIREVIHDIDFEIVERLLKDEDYGGKIVSVLILLFALIAVVKRWKK